MQLSSSRAGITTESSFSGVFGSRATGSGAVMFGLPSYPAQLKPIRVVQRMFCDLVEDYRNRHLDSPPEIVSSGGVVHRDPGDVIGSRGRIGSGNMRTEMVIASRGELAQGHSIRRTSSCGIDTLPSLPV